MVKHGGTFLQIMKLNPKMGFWEAKHGLSKHGFKDHIWSQIGGACREEEKRKKKKRRKEGEEINPSKPKVWNFGFLVGKLTLIMELNGFMEL